MKERPRATKEQIEIARKYRIPLSQAHTVNLKKVAEYEAYLASQKGRDELFLANLETKLD